MNNQLIYFLQVNIGFLLFYGCYRLFFVRDTLCKAHRVYLLLSLVIPIVVPLAPVDLFSAYYLQATHNSIVKGIASMPEFVITATSAEQYAQGADLLALTKTIYLLVTAFFLLRFAIRLTSIIKFRLQGAKIWLRGIPVIAIQKEAAPSSFFKLIFINPNLHSEEETRQILEHEQAHSRQWHSLDIMIAEITSCLFWFNPATWLLKREIRNNHEFLADQEVLHAGIDVKNYQYHLLQATYLTPEGSLGNQFNVSPLKKRIMMMNRKKTEKIACVKYMLVGPLSLALAFVANAQAIEKNVSNIKDTLIPPTIILSPQPAKKQIASLKPEFTKTANVQDATKPANKTVATTQGDAVQPQYPGGEAKLMEYIARNIKYPVKSAENGVQGTVVIRFEVAESGKVTDARIFSSAFKAGDNKESSSSTTTQVNEKDNESKDIRLNEVVVVSYKNGEKVGTADNPDMTSLENEALRLVNNMENWIPAQKNGKPISATYTLPIKYRLQ